MYEAQVTKMQRSLERGDDEKAKVEEQLATAMAYTASGDKQVRTTPLIIAVKGALSVMCQNSDVLLIAGKTEKSDHTLLLN